MKAAQKRARSPEVISIDESSEERHARASAQSLDRRSPFWKQPCSDQVVEIVDRLERPRSVGNAVARRRAGHGHPPLIDMI